MAYERVWPAVSKSFITNGTVRGTLQVSDTTGFYVKQLVSLKSNTQPLLSQEIKRIDPDGTVYVGDPAKNIDDRTDISAFLVTDASVLTANEQKINAGPKPDEIQNFEYERDPIKAKRVIPVDSRGRFYSASNPIPVIDGSKFKYDDLDVASKNANSDPLIINFYLSAVLVATYTFTYDVDGDFQHLHKAFF